MNLKQATTFGLTGMILYLVIELINWILSVFELLPFDKIYKWYNPMMWLINILLISIPLIVFLSVLRSKQKGDTNA
jgi:hypothetical protein